MSGVTGPSPGRCWSCSTGGGGLVSGVGRRRRAPVLTPASAVRRPRTCPPRSGTPWPTRRPRRRRRTAGAAAPRRPRATAWRPPRRPRRRLPGVRRVLAGNRRRLRRGARPGDWVFVLAAWMLGHRVGLVRRPHQLCRRDRGVPAGRRLPRPASGLQPAAGRVHQPPRPAVGSGATPWS